MYMYFRNRRQSVCGLSVGVTCVREKMHSGERTGDVLHDTVELDGAADCFVDDCAQIRKRTHCR